MVVFLLPVQSSLLVYQLPEWVIPLILAAIALGPLLAQVYRYRNVATPTDRQQTKVVVLGLGAIVSFYIMYLITDAIFWNAVRQSPSLIVLYSFSSEATVILTGLLPVSIVAAILRYHLWDVDIIIRRTITYSVVSVLLVTAYFSIVLLAQRVLGGIISSDNSLVMMISTLVVAALFNPLRERVQRTVDRLFYRKRYNAEATLESFRDNIRDAVEPEAIQGHLVQTISSTIQPTTISFWGIDRQ
jgi:hypothetical protein